MASAFDLTEKDVIGQGIDIGDQGLTFTYSPISSPYKSLIDAAEAQYGLPKNVLPRLIQEESGFNPKAVSPKGAEGIAQIMRKYHPTVKNPNDPNEAIPYSASYLKQLYNKFGDWSKAIAAYNTGPENVAAGIIPPETLNYTQKVYGQTPGGNGTGVKSAFDLVLQSPVQTVTKPQVVVAQPKIFKAPEPAGGYDELGRPLSINGVPYPIITPSGSGISNASMLFPISIRSVADIYQKKRINALVSPTNPKGEAISVAPATNEKLQANVPQSWWQWFRSWVQAPEVGKDKAAIIGGLQRQTGISTRDIIKNYDEMTSEVIGRSDTTSLYKMGKRSVEAGMTAGIAVGLAAHPVPTIITLGAFLGIDELINIGVSKAKETPYQFQGGQGIADLIEAQGFSRDAVEVLEFIGEAIFAGGVTSMGRGIIGKSISGAKDKVAAFNDLIDRTKKAGVEDPTTTATKDLKDQLIKDDLSQTGTKVQQIKGTLATDIERAQAKVEEMAYSRTALEAGSAQLKLNKELVSKNIADQKAAKVAAAQPQPEAKSAFDIVKESEIVSVDYQAEADRLGISFKETQEIKGKEFAVFEDTIPGKESSFYMPKGESVEAYLNKTREKYKIAPIELSEDNIVKYLQENGYSKEDAVSIAKSDLASKETGMLTFDEKGERKPVTTMEEYDRQFKEFEAEGTEPVPTRSEPYTEVDEQTGTPSPPELSSDLSPFRNTDSAATAAMSKAFAEKMNTVRQSPEMLTQYFLNEFNRHLNGEEVNVGKARDSLSELAVRADEARGSFGTDADFMVWRESVSEAAAWARRTDRLKIEPTPEPSVRLNISIPLDEIPKAVRDIVERIKGVPIREVAVKELFRNIRIFKNTGFWFGQDAKWRYEIDDSKLKSDFSQRITGREQSLSTVVDYPQLFKVVPNMKATTIKTDYTQRQSGIYNPATDSIILKTGIDKGVLLHEITHAVNFKLGSEFIGSNIQREIVLGRMKEVANRLDDLAKFAKTDHIKRIAVENVSMLRDQINKDQLSNQFVEWFVNDLLPEVKKSESPDLVQKMTDWANIDATKNYLSNPGEMEARVSSIRMNMTAAERRAKPPWETLDSMLGYEGVTYGYRSEFANVGQKLYSGIPLDKLYEQTTETFKKLKNVTMGKGKPKYLGSGPVHGTDIDMLDPILKDGLRPGSAIDIKGGWMEDYPIIVSVPDAVKGKYIDHNKYYESANTSRPTKVVVDLDQYIPSAVDKIRSQIADLAKEYPNVKFDILNDPGKAYTPKYSVEDLTSLYTQATETYKKGTPEIDKLRAEQDTIRQPFMTDKGYWKNISREARQKLDAIDEDIKVLERQRKVEIHRIERKIRDAEKDVSISEGEKFYSGLPLDEMARTILKKGRAFSDAMRKDEQSRNIGLGESAKNFKKLLIRGVVERSGNIRQALIDTLGDRGYKIVETMYLQAGAHPKAVNMLRQMRKEVYGGMSKDNKTIVNDLTMAMRMIDLGKYKTEKQFTFPAGKTPEESLIYKELFAHKETNGIKDLSPKEAADVQRRADAYYEWMKKPVQDAFDPEFSRGLISEKERDDLISHNYRRIRKVEDIFDRTTEVKLGGRKTTVNDSGIQRIQKGKATDVYEASSEIMALETFNRLYGRIYKNKANGELLDLARLDNENPFVRVKFKKEELTGRAADLRTRLDSEGKSPAVVDAAVNKLLENKIPSDFAVNSVKVYENGKPINMFLSPEMAKEWITSNAQLTYKYAQFIRYATGAPLVRTFATGINWAFALRNLPRDIIQIWFTARTFKDGKYESVYSPTVPIASVQMTTDMMRVFRDAVLRKGRYNDYIDDGGGMDLLTTQGRMFTSGKHLESGVDKFYNFAGYPGNTSEILTRLMTRDRVIRNEASKRGITYEEAAKDKDIRRMATFAARDYMDFHQGGDIAKAMDTGFPYLNARLQAARGMTRSMFKDQPVVTAYKLAQFGALVTGLYIGNNALHPETMNALKGDQRTQGNLVFPIGDSFAFEDSKGQTRYPFLVIPIDQGMTFFKTLFEGGTDLWLGNPIDVDRITMSLKNSSPVDLTPIPPTMSGALGYTYNKDFWQNKDIRKQGEVFNYQLPKWLTGKELGGSEEEHGKDTPQALTDIGAATGLSPERLKYLAGQLVTNDNIFASILGKGYDSAFGQLPKKEREFILVEWMASVPIVKSFFKLTNPYSKYAQTIAKSEEMSEIKRFTENRGLDLRAEAYMYDNAPKADVVDYMKSFGDMGTYDRLKKRFDFQVKTQNLDNRGFWLRLEGLGVEARARAYVETFDNASATELGNLQEQQSQVLKIGGLFTDEFRNEVRKYRQSQ